MLEDPVVYEIYLSFNRDNELPYDDMINYIMVHFEVTKSNAERLYKKAEDLYDKFTEAGWLLDFSKELPWMKPLPKI